MAAEIAAKLAVGACCPVCGSAEHPTLAAPAPGAPDDTAEREARREVDDLEVVVEAHAQQVRGLESRLAAALAESGDSVERLLVTEEDTLAGVDRARAVAAQLPTLTAQVEALRAEQDDLAREREQLAAVAAQHDTDAAVLTARLEALRDQVAAVLPDGDEGATTDLDALTARHQQVETLCQQCSDLTAELARARATAASTQEAADELAVAAGFESSAAAASSWLDEGEVAELPAAGRAPRA